MEPRASLGEGWVRIPAHPVSEFLRRLVADRSVLLRRTLHRWKRIGGTAVRGLSVGAAGAGPVRQPDHERLPPAVACGLRTRPFHLEPPPDRELRRALGVPDAGVGRWRARQRAQRVHPDPAIPRLPGADPRGPTAAGG